MSPGRRSTSMAEGSRRICRPENAVAGQTPRSLKLVARWVTFGDPMRYWLMKSEPDEFSIDDLKQAPDQSVAWFGVRNYQARNFMRDQMKVGDQVLFYHSSCPEPGI